MASDAQCRAIARLRRRHGRTFGAIGDQLCGEKIFAEEVEAIKLTSLRLRRVGVSSDQWGNEVVAIIK